MTTLIDDLRAELIDALNLSAAQGAALSVADLQERYQGMPLSEFGSTGQAGGAQDGPWINMILINGFTAVAGFTPQYMKDSRGRVFLRGRVVCPGAQYVPWNSPAGYALAAEPNSITYVDWASGGSDLVIPSRMGSIAPGYITVGVTSANAAGAAGVIANLDRFMWPTV